MVTYYPSFFGWSGWLIIYPRNTVYTFISYLFFLHRDLYFPSKFGAGINGRVRVLHYARPTGQTPVGSSGTLTRRGKMERHQFSNQAGPTDSNGPLHFLFLSRIPWKSEIYWREVEQWMSLSKWNGKFWSDRSRLQSGPLPDVVGPNRNGPFYLTFNQNFRNFSRLIYRKFLLTLLMHCEANRWCESTKSASWCFIKLL